MLPRRSLSLFGLLAVLPLAGCVMRPPFDPARSSPAPLDLAKLSPAALEALVVGVSLYPDPLLEQVLDASMHPLALERAGAPKVGFGLRSKLAESVGVTPASVTYLESWPEVLDALRENRTMTARLGVAYRFQKDDVWAAIRSVRARIAATTAEVTASEGADVVVVDGDVDVYVDAVGLVSAQIQADPFVVAEIESLDVVVESGAIEASFTSESGPSATVQGAGGSAVVENGSTTSGVAGGAALVTGPNGQTVAVGGVAGGSVTATENGAEWQSGAVGGAVNTTTGNYVAGGHAGNGSVTQNADGSVDYSRDAVNGVVSSAGATTMEHHGDAHITGDGSGSYDGSTSIDSTHGSVSTETHASDGQVSTTVTQGNGSSNTYTAGDGQIENGKQGSASRKFAGASTSERSTQGSRSGTQPTRDPDFSSVSKDRVAAGTRGMQKSWGSFGSGGEGSRGGSSSAGRGTGAPRGSAGSAPSFGGRKGAGKPSGGRSGGGRHR